MHIKILYFAQLAELAQKTEETRSLQAGDTVATLYAELQQAYKFPHELAQIQVARNHQLSSHQSPLQSGDTLAFLPPMAGG